MEVPWEEAPRFGLMVTDDDDRITESGKTEESKIQSCSMGIYIFNWDILKQYLIEDEADPNLKMILEIILYRICCVMREKCTRITLTDTERCGNDSIFVGSEYGSTGSGTQWN